MYKYIYKYIYIIYKKSARKSETVYKNCKTVKL